LAKKKATTRTTKKTTARKAAPKKAPAPAASAPRTVTPYLAVGDAAGAIEWYKKVFGAKETARQPAGPKIMHAALKIGDSEIFLSDIFPGSDVQDPSRVGASVTIHVYSPKIDKFWQNAVDNGAKIAMPIDNMFWGDRYGQFVDPFGHRWAVNYKAKMTAAEKEAKRVEAMKNMGAPPQ
jgi:PhnB protein